MTCRDRRGLGGVGGIALGWLLLIGLSGPAVATHEAWDAVYIAGTRCGYIHTTVTPLEEQGRPYFRVRYDMVLKLKRGNDNVNIQTRYGTIETPEGAVLRLDVRTLASQTELRTFGDVIDGQMTLTLESGTQRQQVTIPWDAEIRGPYAVEQSLSRQPIQPGKSRAMKIFVPDLNRVGHLTLTAHDLEEVELGGRVTRSLLRVESHTTVDGKPVPGMDVVHWVDSGGQVLKSFVDMLGGMTIYRTTREAATAPVLARQRYDQLSASIIKVGRQIPNAERTRRVLYRVRLRSGDPAEIFPSDHRQTVQTTGEPNTATIEVRTDSPTSGTPDPESVDERYLRSNVLIDYNDPKIAELTQQAVGNQTDDWAKVQAIEGWVSRNVQTKNFETTFAPASEVARTLAGDCTEHSVLFAALCRAAGIPAKVVVGLVYVDQLEGFGFHMWNEVHVNHRWVAVDSTFNQTAVDATHIKLSETSLDGVSPYETFLPVIQVFDRTTLEVVEIR